MWVVKAGDVVEAGVGNSMDTGAISKGVAIGDNGLVKTRVVEASVIIDGGVDGSFGKGVVGTGTKVVMGGYVRSFVVVSFGLGSMIPTVQVLSRSRHSNYSWISWRRLVESVVVVGAVGGGSFGKHVVCIFQGVINRG